MAAIRWGDGRASQDREWRLKSTYGWTDRDDGKSVTFSDCSAGKIDFGGVSGERIAFDVRDTAFKSHATTLAGRLVMPKGAGKVAVVVFVHGSEDASALNDWPSQRILPAEGVGMFVYDKRGTGKSGGTYTQDFSLLADDAVAAVREARQLAGARLSRIGYHGTSQGGWVAPTRQSRPGGFCHRRLWTGGQRNRRRSRGGRAATTRKGLFRQRHRQRPDGCESRGGRVCQRLYQRHREVRCRESMPGEQGKRAVVQGFARRFHISGGCPIRSRSAHDGAAVQLAYPLQLRSDVDRRRSRRHSYGYCGEDIRPERRDCVGVSMPLIANRRPFTIALYPNADHGIKLFEIGADGSRISTRYAPGYFKMIRDFARMAA